MSENELSDSEYLLLIGNAIFISVLSGLGTFTASTWLYSLSPMVDLIFTITITSMVSIVLAYLIRSYAELAERKEKEKQEEEAISDKELTKEMIKRIVKQIQKRD